MRIRCALTISVISVRFTGPGPIHAHAERSRFRISCRRLQVPGREVGRMRRPRHAQLFAWTNRGCPRPQWRRATGSRDRRGRHLLFRHDGHWLYDRQQTGRWHPEKHHRRYRDSEFPCHQRRRRLARYRDRRARLLLSRRALEREGICAPPPSVRRQALPSSMMSLAKDGAMPRLGLCRGN